MKKEKTRFLFLMFISMFVCLFAACKNEKLEKAAIALQLGDYFLAEEFYRELLHENPANYAARVGLGKALVQKAVANPNDSTLWEQAMVQFEAARSLQATDDIDKLVAESYVEQARRLLLEKDTLTALEFLTKAIQIDTKPVQSLNLAGIVYSRMGQAHRAEVLFEKAVEMDSSYANALFNLGMLRWQQNNINEAHHLWLSTLKILPDNEDVIYWFARAEKRLEEDM